MGAGLALSCALALAPDAEGPEPPPAAEPVVVEYYDQQARALTRQTHASIGVAAGGLAMALVGVPLDRAQCPHLHECPHQVGRVLAQSGAGIFVGGIVGMAADLGLRRLARRYRIPVHDPALSRWRQGDYLRADLLRTFGAVLGAGTGALTYGSLGFGPYMACRFDFCSIYPDVLGAMILGCGTVLVGGIATIAAAGHRIKHRRSRPQVRVTPMGVAGTF